MLTLEQQYEIAKFQQNNELLTAFFDHVKESYLLQIGKTEPAEFKKREWLYSQSQNLDELKKEIGLATIATNNHEFTTSTERYNR